MRPRKSEELIKLASFNLLRGVFNFDVLESRRVDMGHEVLQVLAFASKCKLSKSGKDRMQSWWIRASCLFKSFIPV